MTIELTILLSIVSISVAVVMAFRNSARDGKSDTKQATTEMTTVAVRLENINNGVNEIKSDLRNIRADVTENRERIVAVEASAKQAHKRLDDHINAKNKEET